MVRVKFIMHFVCLFFLYFYVSNLVNEKIYLFEKKKKYMRRASKHYIVQVFIFAPIFFDMRLVPT